MSLLPEQDKFDVWREFMANNTENLSLTKADLRAVVDAADVFAQNYRSDLNAALPQVGQEELSQVQQADMFARILRKRDKARI